VDSTVKRIIALVACVCMLVAVFLPAFDVGFASMSLWDGLQGDSNGSGIVVLLFSLLALVFALMEKYDYVQAGSIGVFSITLAMVIDMVRAEAAEYIGIGVILLMLGSLLGTAVKEIPLHR